MSAMRDSATEMNLQPIVVTGPADRLLVAALHEIAPLIDELRSGVLLIGGLMTRLWLHGTPETAPVRPTADVDLGIDRGALHLHGDRRRVDPALRRLGFAPGHGDEPFRYSKTVDGVGQVIVDVLVAPGSSREDPPVVEAGLQSLAAPGLAYAIQRRSVDFEGEFVDGATSRPFNLPLPTADAAFVLKAALVAKGARTRPDRVLTDTVDALAMAAVCLQYPEALAALRVNRGRSDVRASLAWLADAFRSLTAIGARRVEDHYREEGLGAGMGEWASNVAAQLIDLAGPTAAGGRGAR